MNIRKGKKGRKVRHNGLRVLLDSGSSHCIADKRLVKNAIADKSTFATGAGALNTKYKKKLLFSLPEFSESKIIDWEFSLTDSEHLGYDIIIGRDLMRELGIVINFNDQTVSWEGTDIPMRDLNRLRKLKMTKKELNTIIKNSNEPVVTQEATDRMIKILDSNYKKANLKEVIKGAKHLNEENRQKLYKLLVQ